MSARIWSILVGSLLVITGVGLVYSSTLLSGWTPVQKFQFWADQKLTKLTLSWNEATARPLPEAGLWLPGKVRMGEIQREDKVEKLYWVGAEVKQWDADNGVLSLESFGKRIPFSAHIRPGVKSSEQRGTMVLLPKVASGEAKITYLVPDFWEEDNQLPDSTWRLMFCPKDAIQVGWLVNQPLSQTADFWGNMRKGLNIESEVIINYLRRLPCIQ